MCELLEKVTKDMDKNLEPGKCPFQQKQKNKNKPNPTPGEDNDTYNDSGELTVQLEQSDNPGPFSAKTYPARALKAADFRSDGPDIGTNVGLFPNAHHLVPGHASLPKSNVAKFMGDKDNMPEKCKKPSKIKDGGGGIGYDVNGPQNGKWLPSNNALRGRWRDNIQAEYAFIAINRTKSQFHDAHTDYNKYIRDRLEEIYVKLNDHIKNCNLKPCKEKRGSGDKFETAPHPYLCQKLYGVSSRIKKYLDLSNRKFWRVPDVTTSRFNAIYCKIAEGDITTPKTIKCGGGKATVKVTDPAITAVKEKRTDNAR
jgi:hypothetical protein